MLDSIKKNGWLVLAGLVLLVLVKFLWPDDTEEQVLHVEAKPVEKREIEIPKPTTPVATNKPTQVTTIEHSEPVESTEEIDEEIFFEEEVPEKRKYVLCEYIVSGETQYEFTAQIRLINKGSEAIYGWSVQWEFEDGSTIISASNVALGGSNPYTGEYLSSNAEIAPGETVTFSFTGAKAGESGPKGVKVEGEFCM